MINRMKHLSLAISALCYFIVFFTACTREPGEGLSMHKYKKMHKILNEVTPKHYSILDGEIDNSVEWVDLRRIDSTLSAFYKNKYHFSCGHALVEVDGGYRFLGADNRFTGRLFSSAEDYREGWAKVTHDGQEDYLWMGDNRFISVFLSGLVNGVWFCKKEYEQEMRGWDDEGNPYSTGEYLTFTEYDILEFDWGQRRVRTLFGYDDSWHPFSIAKIEKGVVSIKSDDRFSLYVDGIKGQHSQSKQIYDDNGDIYSSTNLLTAFFYSSLSSSGYVAFSPKKDYLRGDEFLIFYPSEGNLNKGRLVDYGRIDSKDQIREVYDYIIEDNTITVPNECLNVPHRSITSIINQPVKIESESTDATHFEDGLVVKLYRGASEPEREYTVYPDKSFGFSNFVFEINRFLDASNGDLTLEGMRKRIVDNYGDYHQRYPTPHGKSEGSYNSELNQEYQRLMTQLNSTADPMERQRIQAQMSIIKSQIETSQREFINRLTR